MSTESSWPRTVPQLSVEQERIPDDFMRHRQEVLPDRYSVIEGFSSCYAVRSGMAEGKTLEVPIEIVTELTKIFEILERRYFPVRVPITATTLVIGLTIRSRS